MGFVRKPRELRVHTGYGTAHDAMVLSVSPLLPAPAIAVTSPSTRRAGLRPSAAEAIERSSLRFDDAESRAWSLEQAAKIREEVERFRSGMQPAPLVLPPFQPEPEPAPTQ